MEEKEDWMIFQDSFLILQNLKCFFFFLTGPVLAPKSYFPPASNTIFPLVIFNDFWNGEGFMNDLSDDIKELFTVKNYYLDTSDENNCNWMIHVDIAKFSNEQNLICYQVSLHFLYFSSVIRSRS